MKPIIAVSGLVEDEQGNRGSAGAGKDLVADILVSKHGFVRIALADEMKRIAQRLWDFSGSALWGPSEERNKLDERYPTPNNGYLTPRFVLQKLGTEVGRSIDPDVWVRHAVNMSKSVLEQGFVYSALEGVRVRGEYERRAQGVVISDLRYPNEMKLIRKAGGQIWRKKRNTQVLPGAAATHTSETALLDIPDSEFDLVLPSFETTAELEALIASVHSVVGGK